VSTVHFKQKEITLYIAVPVLRTKGEFNIKNYQYGPCMFMLIE